MNIIFKIKKRFFFESNKRIRKLKYIIFKEWFSDVNDGFYDERKIITNDLEKLCGFYDANNHKRKSEISDADRIIQGENNLIYFDNTIKVDDWNTDYSSGYIYPIRYYGDIKYIINDNKTDVKNVWELSRLQHLVIVAKAYAITGDDRYYNYYKERILSWIDSNPYGKSVNWTCNMEVAIRVVNLIISYDLVKQKIVEDKEFMSILKSTIYYHNEHIYDNLENYSEKRNNHYLSNLMGLLISSKFLENKNIDKYKKYQLFAKLEIQSEIDKQIYNDGVTYEISSSYQKLVFEILLLSFILGESEGNKFEDKYFGKLQKMSIFLKSIENSDGYIPLIGDNDSGNIVVFDDYFNEKKSNLNSVLDLSDYYFNSNVISKYSITSYLGKTLDSDYDTDERALSYRDSGYYILENNTFKMILICGPLSMMGQGGHSHNDQLSFILNVNGVPIFIDPGTITYTGNPDLRNHSRQTSSHNTVQISKEEQNLIGSDLFSMTERTYSNCTLFSHNEFSGSHKGFIEKYGCIHNRHVKIDDNKVIILDTLTKTDQRNLTEGSLHLILDRNVKCFDDQGMLSLFSGMITLVTNIKFVDCVVSEMLASDRYGHYYKTEKITLMFLGSNKLEIKLK